MARDNLFQILAEILVKSHRGVPLLGFPKDFGDWPSAAVLRPEYGDRPVVLLDDYLDALLHPGQDGMEIASHFSFAHVDSSHHPYYGASSLSSSCSVAESDRDLEVGTFRSVAHLSVVLAQQIFAVVVAVWCSHHHVNMLVVGRLGIGGQVPEPHR